MDGHCLPFPITALHPVPSRLRKIPCHSDGETAYLLLQHLYLGLHRWKTVLSLQLTLFGLSYVLPPHDFAHIVLPRTRLLQSNVSMSPPQSLRLGATPELLHRIKMGSLIVRHVILPHSLGWKEMQILPYFTAGKSNRTSAKGWSQLALENCQSRCPSAITRIKQPLGSISALVHRNPMQRIFLLLPPYFLSAEQPLFPAIYQLHSQHFLSQKKHHEAGMLVRWERYLPCTLPTLIQSPTFHRFLYDHQE